MSSLISRHNAITLRKLAKLPHKNRNKYLKDWPITAFKDIKNISNTLCKCKKIPEKTLKLLKPHSKIIRKISLSKPDGVKKILTTQKGGAIFSVLAATLIPLIIDQIVKAVK